VKLENPWVETIHSFEVMANFWVAMGNASMAAYCDRRVLEISKKARSWDLAAANVEVVCLDAQDAVIGGTR
jgi:hypothetical protein